jgi:hypothetical protein
LLGGSQGLVELAAGCDPGRVGGNYLAPRSYYAVRQTGEHIASGGALRYLGPYLHEAANNALRLHVLAPDEPNVSRAGLPLGETPPGWVLQTKAERA